MTKDEEALDYTRFRATKDTGYLAREVLGFNYDRHWKTGERVTPGGVREDGPHGQMVALVDSPSQNKLLMAPRGSYKTTIVQSYAIRRILENPNVRIHYVMSTYDEAKKTVAALKDHFERNEKLIELFGNLKPSRTRTTDNATASFKWGTESFTVAQRTDVGIKEPTFWAGGTDKNSTGGHCDVLILDDLVNWQNARTEEGIKKAIECFRANQPLLDPGGTLIVACTLYNDADLSCEIRNSMKDLFEVLVLDSGVDLVRSDTGTVEVVGDPLFKHQPIEFLQAQFGKMNAADFSRQYLNRSLASGMALFRRTHFRELKWDRWMESMALYILTDTATGANEDNCYSVIAVVGLDVNNVAYLVDLRVGHMTPAEYTTTFVDVVQKWQNKGKVRAALFEKIALNRVFGWAIKDALRSRNVRVELIDVPRGAGEPSKKQRIQRLHRRFEDGMFFVVNTVPPTFNDMGEVKELWNSEGFHQAGMLLPDGELVREFIRFPVYPKNDIADAIADIDALHADGNRICVGMSRTRHEEDVKERKRRGQVVTMPRMVNGREELVNVVQSQPSGYQTNIWGDLMRRIH